MANPPPNRLRAFAEGLLRYRLALLLGAVVLVGVAWPVSQRLEFRRSLESLFAADNPTLANYQESKALFGGDEFLLVAYEAPPDLFASDETLRLRDEIAERIREFSRELGRVPGVADESTQNLADALQFPYRRGQVLEMLEGVLISENRETLGIVLRLTSEENAPPRSQTFRQVREVAAGHNPPAFIVGEPIQIYDMFRYVEQDGQVLFWWSLVLLATVLFLLFFNLRWMLLPLAVVVAAVVWTEALLVVSGMKLSMVSSMLNSLVTIIGIATVTHVAVHYRELVSADDSPSTRGATGAGPKGSPGETPPGLAADPFRRPAVLGRTLAELLPPIAWTCVTTAVGFLALLSSRILPVRSFGMMMALATMLVLVSAAVLLPGGVLFARRGLGRNRSNGAADQAGMAGFLRRGAELRRRVSGWVERHPAARLPVTLVPGAALVFTLWMSGAGFDRWSESGSGAGFVSPLARGSGESPLFWVVSGLLLGGWLLFGRWDADPAGNPGEGRLTGLLGRLAGWVERHPWPFGLIPILVMLLAAGGLVRLEVQTDFSKNFRRSSPIRQSLNFVETRLGGAGTWEVNFEAPAELSPHYLDRVEHLTQRLRRLAEDPDRGLTKVVSLTDGLDLAPKEVGVGFLSKEFSLRDRLGLLNNLQPEFVPTLYNRERGRMRIMLRAREQQSAERKERLISDVRQVAREQFPQAEVTGPYVLLAQIIQSLLRDQLVSFILATVGIGLTMALAFGSVRIGLISLIPNIFPIAVVVGTMGWAGLPINIGTAMIACVSMGLTVDGTIHYIAGFRRVRRQGGSFADGLAVTHRNVGRALLFANFALIVGFLVLTLSHFIPLVYFGMLVSVAMLGGVVADLIVLPVLLKWTETN